MAKRKKSGKSTLRMEPNLHARVARAAESLGMTMNSLINLLIENSLPPFEALADQKKPLFPSDSGLGE